MTRHTPSTEELTLIAVDRRPIVFLDIDGVLNNMERWDTSRAMTRLPHYCKIDLENVLRLSRLIEATNPVVVLSSTWRHSIHYRELRDRLVSEFGLTPQATFTSETPYVSDRFRGQDIQMWMTRLAEASTQVQLGTVPPVTVETLMHTCVILDDLPDLSPLTHRHVRIDEQVGLTDGDVDAAVRLLQGGIE